MGRTSLLLSVRNKTKAERTAEIGEHISLVRIRKQQ